MRGNLSDQDLTDYALNELRPEERLYLESMLAVSEPCRQDIYKMIELGQMLEESFELEEEQSRIYSLTHSQRNDLLEFRRGVTFWHKSAAAVGLAASIAFVLTQPGFWQSGDPAGKVAQVSTQMSKIVAAAVTPGNVNFVTPLANIAAFAEESWLPSASLEPIVCTPPSWLETAQLSAVSEMVH